MDELFWARSTMALSLGFHIIFASISMVLPFYMAWAHHRFLCDGHEVHLRLTRAWSRGAAALFATGAVSGTALSFQLGLLWPGAAPLQPVGGPGHFPALRGGRRRET